ncbi:MAG: LysR substrate-binding domain-containing protein [Rhodovibrionaceae bacterium]
MARRNYDLPSLTALAAFEAAARHLSLKRASEELNVTPGAVSRQIKALEGAVGCALFLRRPRGVELTAEGEALYGTLSRSFSQIAETYHRLQSAARTLSVTIGATTAFASMWLMPRLGAFWRAHQDITINHAISDDPRELRTASVDLRVRYGTGVWPDETSLLLFGDRIYPVCGPGFGAQHRVRQAEELLALPLLQLAGVDPSWTDWEEWLRRAGVVGRPRAGRSFNNYVIALQAAQDDQGLALGWHSLVAPLLAEKKLVRLGKTEIEAPGGFYVTWNASRDLTAEAVALRDWLLAQTPTPG